MQVKKRKMVRKMVTDKASQNSKFLKTVEVAKKIMEALKLKPKVEWRALPQILGEATTKEILCCSRLCRPLSEITIIMLQKAKILWN